MNDFFKKMISTFSDFSNFLGEKFEENKKLFITIIFAIILILICIIGIIVSASSKKQDKNQETFDVQLKTTEKPLIFENEILQNDYELTRKPKTNWSDEEIKPWFSEPAKEDVENLSQANDRIISEITGAAP